MQKIRIVSFLLLLLLFFPSIGISAVAVEYEVTNFEELEDAFNDNSGENVTIFITEIIDFGGFTLTTKEGIVYDISGKDNLILRRTSFDGSGTVNMHDVELVETKGHALMASGDVTVNVTGKINGKNKGLCALDNSTVTVEGDITAIDSGVVVQNSSTVSIKGNITARNLGLLALEDANITVDGDISAKESMQANDNGTITINGNVISTKLGGPFAWANSKITINGNVTAAKNGVSAYRNGAVTVYGNISAGEYGATAGDNGIIIINGNVTGGNGNPDLVNYSDPASASNGYYAIGATGSATINISGNVRGGDGYGLSGKGGIGVLADEMSTVTVNGNVVGGSVTTNAETDPGSEKCQSRGGDGAMMINSATISISGNAIGGSTNVRGGSGGNGASIVIRNVEAIGGSMTISGIVQGAEDSCDLFLANKAENDPPVVCVPSITLGTCGSIDADSFSEDAKTEIVDGINIINKITSEENNTESASLFAFLWNLIIGERN